MSQRKHASIWFRGLRHRRRFKKRYDIINYFVRTRQYKTYLEIGTGAGRCMERVTCASKTGVDPAPKRKDPDWTLHQMTSDEFFHANTGKFDLIFIDGLHTADQVIKDIFNSLAALAANGVILLHDSNPLTEEMQVKDPQLAAAGQWNGDVWKAIVYIRKCFPALFCRVFSVDQGVGIIIPDEDDPPPAYTPEVEKHALEFFENVTWDDLQEDRRNLLGLVDNQTDFEGEFRRHQSKRNRAK